jgi:hypothetical protein
MIQGYVNGILAGLTSSAITPTTSLATLMETIGAAGFSLFLL